MAILDTPLSIPSKNFESDQNQHRANAKVLEEWAQSVYLQLVPTGTILMYAGATAPTGYLMCNGAAVSRLEYATLFAILGTAHGIGDGSTTFNLPNMFTASASTNRVPAGVGIGFALGTTQSFDEGAGTGVLVALNFIIKT